MEGYQLSVYSRVIRKILQGRRDVREPLVEHILSARVERSRGAVGSGVCACLKNHVLLLHDRG